jgi:hypothetical protein
LSLDEALRRRTLFGIKKAHCCTQIASLAALVLLVASSNQAFAWGYSGHRIIAEIAEQFIDPDTAHKVRDLLAVENVTTLADVSTWADQIRVQRPETAHWHYVNIPIHLTTGEPATYDANRDCPNDDCVVAKIAHFERVLADRQISERERLEALNTSFTSLVISTSRFMLPTITTEVAMKW